MPEFTIDSLSYPKAVRYPQRHGYQMRGTFPTSIVVHSTSNRQKNTPFTAEAKFLFESADVSAHYLVGKDGRIVQFLEPGKYQAWHAGAALEAFVNARSIGIELHHSVNDTPYPKEQIAALTWLVKELIKIFSIPLEKIETHGQIALPGPYDRKKDPINWPYAEFLRWRASLKESPKARYLARHTEAIQEAPHASAPVALADTAHVAEGAIIEVDEERADGYLHLASGVGFVRSGVFTKL